MTADHSLEDALLKLFASAREHQLSATTFKSRLAGAAKGAGLTTDPAAVDAAITALIEAGKVAVTGGGKTGHHPRPRGSYRLTGAGKDHVKPAKPGVSDELGRNQEAYILFQFLRAKGGDLSLTRSDLNDKFKTVAARAKLELAYPDKKATTDYHLHQLVANGNLLERRQGVSVRYTLTPEGLKALGAGKQYDDVEVNFALNGKALNRLLDAARLTADAEDPQLARHTNAAAAIDQPISPAASKNAQVSPEQIHDFIAQLKADRYAGKDLIPIHEVRTLVAQHHGDNAASHPVFDRLLKVMRSEGELEIIAISDSRETPQQHLDDAIPGLNEVLFFIDTK